MKEGNSRTGENGNDEGMRGCDDSEGVSKSDQIKRLDGARWVNDGGGRAGESVLGFGPSSAVDGWTDGRGRGAGET